MPTEPCKRSYCIPVGVIQDFTMGNGYTFLLVDHISNRHFDE